MGVKIGSLDISAFKVGSSDCKVYLGDVLLYPQTVSYKLIAQYSDTSEYKVECNGNAVLTAAEVSAHTTPKSAMTSAIVGSCDGQGSFKIGDNAFYGASAMTSVTIDNAVTEIGQQSFMGCSGLTSFTFPSGLTKINGSTFRLCNKITSINVPNGVRYIGSGAFADMAELTGATIPATLTGASTNLFLRDANLKEVHFEGTTPPTLGADAFKGCTALSKIYIPSCDSYDDYAANAQFSAYTDLIYAEDATKCKGESYPFVFKREHKGGSAYTRACDSSSATTLTSGMTRSGTSMFVITGTSKQVTAITIGDCTKKVDTNAFSGWTKVSSVTLSDSVQEIGSRAFYECGKIAGGANTTLKIGSGIKKLDYFCFGNNNEISNVILPGKTINFSSYTFSNCNALTGVTFKEGFNISGTTSPVYYNGQSMFNQCKLAKVSLPNSLTSIPPSMFYGNPITSLTIGSGVTIIGGNAFYNHKINNLVIPDNVVTIEGSAFKTTAATVFDSVKIGNGCTSIGSSALTYNFENIDIGSGITSISSYGIYNAKCKKLICRATTPPSCGTSAFYSWTSGGVTYPQIYVPDESVNAYKSASFWSTHSAKIHPLSDLPS